MTNSRFGSITVLKKDTSIIELHGHICDSQSQTCQLLIFLNIESKLWKVVQPEVQLMSINFKFEVPILWLFQVVYNRHIKQFFTVCHSRQINVATWFLVLPIDIENKSTTESINIYKAIYRVFGIIFSRSLSQKAVVYRNLDRVGDNRRTVNTSTSPHISGQLGTNNPC